MCERIELFNERGFFPDERIWKNSFLMKIIFFREWLQWKNKYLGSIKKERSATGVTDLSYAHLKLTHLFSQTSAYKHKSKIVNNNTDFK